MTRPPEADELYVAVFGPGVGESSLVHIGEDHWIVIDSCIPARETRPIALTHLEKIGRSTDVIKLIVATHWHDDHLRGLATILEEARNATFVCSAALSHDEFNNLLGHAESIGQGSGADEMVRIRELLYKTKTDRPERYRVPSLATEGTVLYRKDLAGYAAMVTALSPSSGEVWAAIQEIRATAAAASESITARALVSDRNRASVTLLVEALGCTSLFGADLETGVPGVGWEGVLASKTRPKARAEFVKVPHHGSIDAYHPGVWTHMVAPAVVAAVTPYRRGKTPLPREADLKRVCVHTDGRLYVTAHKTSPAGPRRDPAVERILKSAILERKILIGSAGPVSAYWKAGSQPTVVLGPGAYCACH